MVINMEKVVCTIIMAVSMIAIAIIDIAMIPREFKKGKCTAKAKGKVIKYTRLSNGGDSVHFRPPVAEYMVDGIQYTAWGPRFKTYVAKTVSSPAAGFITEQQWSITEDGKLIVHKKRNSFISITRNIAEEMYPIGTEVDVYYDPKKPRRAYAVMYYKRKWVIIYLSVISASVYMTMIMLIVALWRFF